VPETGPKSGVDNRAIIIPSVELTPNWKFSVIERPPKEVEKTV
jgi:hypothetical protein